MKRIDTEILVIGGGSTGTGVAWDAALRGFKVVLVEERDLTHGTTGRYHGLLHSGGRYVVKDPQSAVECIQENRILRTHPHPLHRRYRRLLRGHAGGRGRLPRPLQGRLRRDRHALRRDIAWPKRCAANRCSTRASAASSRCPTAPPTAFWPPTPPRRPPRNAGASILTYHEVISLVIEGDEGDRRVVGAQVRDMVERRGDR